MKTAYWLAAAALGLASATAGAQTIKIGVVNTLSGPNADPWKELNKK